MLRPRNTDDDPEVLADADTSLRDTSRLFARGLANLVVRPDETILALEWGETQVAAHQQRMDRVLIVDVSPDHRKVLHIEWTMRLDDLVTDRAAGYHIKAAISVRQDLRRLRGADEPKMRVTVKTYVVVLTGREAPWPETGELRTSEDHEGFTGVQFVIEPVYQRTVEELEEKGSVFWQAFVPLARDVDKERLRRTLNLLRTRATEEEFVAVILTMMSMAQLKKDRPELLDMIRSEVSKEAPVRHPWFEDGKTVGLQEGLEKGRHETLSVLTCIFERRLRRPLREGERKRIALRLAKQGPQKLGSVVADLSPKALAAWLAPRKTQKSKAV
jgi:hypothetical protein